MNLENKGLVLIFTGEGKGKTSSALGTALRAYGAGLSVSVLFFMKGSLFDHSDFKALDAMKEIEVKHFGGDEWVFNTTDKTKHIEAAKQGLEYAKKIMSENKINVLILDEIITCVNSGLLEENDVIELTRSKPYNMHIVLTGRNASERLVELADTVTEMKCIKHAYQNGINAVKGIDY